VFINPRGYHPPSSLCCGLAIFVTRVTRQVPLAEQELPRLVYWSDCCLKPIQLYHGENKLIFNEMMMRSALL